LQDRLTALANPPLEVTVHVLLAPPPWVTVRLDGLQETAKLGVGVAVTDTDRLAVRTVAPLVPWAWMANVPVAAVAAAEMVRLLPTLPFAGGVTGLGEYAQVTPAGRFTQARLTALAKPPEDVTVQVVSALWPCWTL